jgi:bacterioferritin (cytochrome b1)
MTNEKKTSGAVEKKPARRELLGAGGAAAAMLLGLAFSACGDDDDPTPTGDGGPGDGGRPLDGGIDSGLDAGTASDGGALDADVATLNALLTAEYTAIKAYTAGGTLIGTAPNTDPLYTLRDSVVQIATGFVGHHTAAAAALVDAIVALGGTPVAQANVPFTPPAGLTASPTILNVLRFAATAERGAAVSYNKAVSTLEAAKHRFLASTIEGVATQHFIVIAALVLGLATPGAGLAATGATARVVPKPFVVTVGSAAGLDAPPPAAYFP